MRAPSSKLTWRSVVAAFGAGFIIVSIPAVAFAVTEARGPNSYFGPIYGINYKDSNGVTISPSVFADTLGAKNGLGNVPSGYIGAAPRLYYGNGSLCAYKSMQYMPGAGNSFDVPTTNAATACGTGKVYYSDGNTSFYTPSGYQSHDTAVSPKLNF